MRFASPASCVWKRWVADVGVAAVEVVVQTPGDHVGIHIVQILRDCGDVDRKVDPRPSIL